MKPYTPNFQELDKLTDQGYLRKVISPCGRLCLYNYTDKCTYEKKWNKHTLNSRGSVYEIETGRVIARAFPKFFNLSELPASKSRNLKKRTDFTVAEKADGSLGIIYYYDGEWRVNTRGSFTSEQAIKGKELLEKYNTSELFEECTYLVEIIYPENKIVVDYGSRKQLTLLTIFETESGEEIGSKVLFAIGPGFPLTVKYVYSFAEMLELQKTLPKDHEGFVVRFSDGERVKIKGHEYLKIARLKSNLTPLNFWRNMEGGRVKEEILQELPEELEKESEKLREEIEQKYSNLATEIQLEYLWLMQEMKDVLVDEMSVGELCREIGLYIKSNPEKLKHPKIIFAFLKHQEDLIEKYIMKIIRPKGNEL